MGCWLYWGSTQLGLPRIFLGLALKVTLVMKSLSPQQRLITLPNPVLFWGHHLWPTGPCFLLFIPGQG